MSDERQKRQQFNISRGIVSTSDLDMDELEVQHWVEDAIRAYAEKFGHDVRLDEIDVGPWDEVDEPSLSAADRNPSMVGQ